jgi:pSer/pThr/pTyr-binding forkhead associated (FHA) protein
MGAHRAGDGPHPGTARELQAIIYAEREGVPFLVYRDAGETLRIAPLPTALTVGRNPAANLSIPWDDEVSALHAQLEHLAGELTLIDDGLSRNGSYVNDERIHGRRRLHNGDRLRFGRTVVLVRKPTQANRRATIVAQEHTAAVDLSEQQRKVLIALCRPLNEGNPFAAPATNRQIADEMHLSVAAVKLHLRALFEKFKVKDLPQNQKRLALAGRARDSGLITDREPAS